MIFKINEEDLKKFLCGFVALTFTGAIGMYIGIIESTFLDNKRKVNDKTTEFLEKENVKLKQKIDALKKEQNNLEG